MRTAAVPRRTPGAWPPDAEGAKRLLLAGSGSPQPSVVLLQVHARVQLPNLGLVAVEHQGLALLGEKAILADAPLGRLAPTRVIDFRVHVGIKAVFVGSSLVPGSLGFAIGEADP